MFSCYRLERERTDLLNKQERRLLGSRPRSRPTYSNSNSAITSLSNISSSSTTGKGPALVSYPNPPKAKQRPNPHTSTPSLHWLTYGSSANDENPSLTKSTNSLADQYPQHQHRRSAVSKTFTLTRSGSASVSPSRRSRESSDSSDNNTAQNPNYPTLRQRTTTLVLTSKTPVTASSVNSQRSGPQTPVGVRRAVSRGGEEDEFLVLYPQRRPRQQNFISTSNCNLYTPNNQGLGDSGRLPRTSGASGNFVISSSPLPS